jgi:hypothetical protein
MSHKLVADAILDTRSGMEFAQYLDGDMDCSPDGDMAELLAETFLDYGLMDDGDDLAAILADMGIDLANFEGVLDDRAAARFGFDNFDS